MSPLHLTKAKQIENVIFYTMRTNNKEGGRLSEPSFWVPETIGVVRPFCHCHLHNPYRPL